MTDDAAHGCAAQRAQRAAAQHSATNGTCARANGRAFFLRRHAGAATQAKQQGCE